MRKRSAKKSKNKQELANELEIVKNGLSEAILGFNPANIGTQIQQADTLFINNRWYLVSNMRQLLSEIYVEHGIVQTVVDVPVDDGLRGGVDVITDQLSPDENKDLIAKMEQEDDMGVVAQASKWNRLFGGAGIITITDQDYKDELDIKAIKEDSPLEFRAVDLWELFWDKQNTEGFNPELYQQDFTHYSYYGKDLHKSRVMKLVGTIPPSFIRPRLRGWGLSIVEQLVSSINQYLKANNLIFEVLDEFKIDIYKIKNLANTLLSANGTAQIQKRVQLANQQKNFQNAITMDSEDDFDSKELSFAGIAETMVGIRMKLASDLRMPLTKIFGISAAGFSSGEDDIENYNAMVESQIRSRVKYDILKMTSLRCQQMFGHIPDDMTIEFKPLRILGAEQEENVKTQQYNRLITAVQAGMMTTKEFKEACNKDNLLSIQVDTSIEQIQIEAPGGEGRGSGAIKEEKKAAPVSSPKSTISSPTAKNSLEDK